MSIVKYTNPKTGVIYAYESTGNWNPITRRNEPVRTYLGRINPETGEIIPTGGKRGRRRHTETTEPIVPTSAEYENVVRSLGEMQTMLKEQATCIQRLEKENDALKAILSNVAKLTLQYAG